MIDRRKKKEKTRMKRKIIKRRRGGKGEVKRTTLKRIERKDVEEKEK